MSVQASVSLMDEEYFDSCSPEFQDLADALLVVEDKRLRVHKAILAAKSPTFAKMFTSCSATEQDAKMEVPLDDSLPDVCTALKYLYQGCAGRSASKLQSVEDSYRVISFAHKYDVPELLEQCEAYLVEQLATPNKVFIQPGDAVRWTLLAEKCELNILLAHCELFMAEKKDGDFWSNLAENTMHLSGDSMRRMLKVGAWHRRNGEAPPAVKHLIRWQPGTCRVKRKAEDSLQADGDVNLRVRHEQTHHEISFKTRRRMTLSRVFTAFKRSALQRGWLSPVDLPTLKFMFDGDVLCSTETVEDLDCDATAAIKIEVTW